MHARDADPHRQVVADPVPTIPPLSSSSLSLTVRADGIAVLAYDVADAQHNPIAAGFFAEWSKALDAIAQNPAICAAVLVSSKEQSWVEDFEPSMLQAVATAAEGEALCRRGHTALRRLAASPKPFVAAVHGAALGFGFALASLCHGRVLSDDPRTVLGFSEIHLGLLPPLSGLERLIDALGLESALDHALYGRRIPAGEARGHGLADRVVPAANLVEEAAALAHDLATSKGKRAKGSPPGARKSLGDRLTRTARERMLLGRRLLFRDTRRALLQRTGGHYPAPERLLDIFEALVEREAEAACTAHARAFGELVVSSASRRLTEIAAARANLARPTGVGAPHATPRPIGSMALLGTSQTSAAIGHLALAAGLPVKLQDADEAALGRCTYAMITRADTSFLPGEPTGIERARRFGKLTRSLDVQDTAEADLVALTGAFDLDAATELVRKLEAQGPPGRIIALCDPALPLGLVAAAATRPEIVIGMHYAWPVDRAPLVEIAHSARTLPEVLATMVTFGRTLGKIPLRVGDGPGQYLARLLGPLLGEAFALLDEGLGIEVIDQAMVAWGWPRGPFALLDLLEIEQVARVGALLERSFGPRLSVARAWLRFVKEQERRNEQKHRPRLSFYRYDETRWGRGRTPRVDDGIYAALDLPLPRVGPKASIFPEEIQMRASLRLVNEAIYALDEGVIASAQDGDLGATLGVGFPRFRGGPFRYTDALGSAELHKRLARYEQRFGARFSPAPLLVSMAAHNRRFYP